MVITHNVSALNTYKALGSSGSATNKSMEKLSSGYRINRAGDDAAGLSISEKMRSQIRGLNQATTNAENGVSMIQTAEGALNETHSILQRIRELAVQSATDTNADEDREALQSEVDQLVAEVQRIADTTEFNGMKIVNGDKSIKYSGASATTAVKDDFADAAAAKAYADKFDSKDYEAVASGTKVTVTARELVHTDADKTAQVADLTAKVGTGWTVTGGNLGTAGEDKSLYFHVGANKDQVINVSFEDMGAVSLGIGKVDSGKVVSKIDITTRDGANKALNAIDFAISKVSEERSKYGAVQNRLEYTINNLKTTSENMTSAESTIRDVDMAKEMMEYTKNNILQQAAQAMLVQANARPQQALQLLE
ncbi:MAG: flagellin [Clostridia bacterium]|nr:flagellin [Clostridia bacterium]